MKLRSLSLALGALPLLVVSQSAAQDFHGYPCTQDCSGHEAGYEWAGRKGIDSASDCSGNSNSFIEGCQAYVEENMPAPPPGSLDEPTTSADPASDASGDGGE